jgi:hypothetical protein
MLVATQEMLLEVPTPSCPLAVTWRVRASSSVEPDRKKLMTL